MVAGQDPFEQGGLTGTRAAHDRRGLTPARRERDVLEHRMVGTQVVERKFRLLPSPAGDQPSPPVVLEARASKPGHHH